MTSPQQHHSTVSIQDSRPRRFQIVSLLIAVIFSLLTLLEAHLTLLRQVLIFKEEKKKLLLIFFGQRNEGDKNDSVEARQNLDGSGEDQDELQRSGTTLICREEENGGRI